MNNLQITEEWRQIDYHDPDASVMGIIKITDVSKIYVLVNIFFCIIVLYNLNMYLWSSVILFC